MRNRVILGSLLLVFAITTYSVAQGPAGNVARGKYLVNNVATCGDCHTPTDKKGQPIKGKQLQGSALVFKPAIPIPSWIPVAPSIAGLNWTDAQAIEFFTTGKRPDGTMAAPPMPQIRLKKADAAAVTAYLKSLKP